MVWVLTRCKTVEAPNYVSQTFTARYWSQSNRQESMKEELNVKGLDSRAKILIRYSSLSGKRRNEKTGRESSL